MPDHRRLDIVVGLTYYAPYVSGLSEYARSLAEEMIHRGHQVTVVTSKHEASLPSSELINGVRVIRCPVIARVSKGTVSPSLPFTVARLGRRDRIVHLHLPMLEAGLIARFLWHQRPIVTYHCDVLLGRGAINRVAVAAVDRSSRGAIGRSATVTVGSCDYVGASRMSRALNRAHLTEVAPPCRYRAGGEPRYRDGPGKHIGFLGRLVAEKGIGYLVRAFRANGDPAARLLIAGNYQTVAGGSVIDEIAAIMSGDTRIRLLGHLPEDRIPDFYSSIDVLALPSINALESFGIVQAEAVMAGVPVIASDRPGVRRVVAETGYGMLVPEANVAALTSAIERIDKSKLPTSGPAKARDLFGIDAAVAAFERIYSAGTARAV